MIFILLAQIFSFKMEISVFKKKFLIQMRPQYFYLKKKGEVRGEQKTKPGNLKVMN